MGLALTSLAFGSKYSVLIDIELENGQMEKVYKREGEVRAEVEGIGAGINVRCLNMRG